MPTLTLHSNPMSRGRIARWMLEEIAEPYDVRLVEFGADAAELRRLNPMGKVPTLVHGETVVSEAAAICAYLADAFPGAGLAPDADAPERGPYYRWLFFAAGPLEAAVTNRAMGWTAEGREQMLGYGSYERALDALSDFLEDRDYVLGDRMSAADVYLGAQVSWGLAFGTIEKRPAFETYAGRMNDRPAARRATEADEAWAAELQRGTG